MAKEFCQQHGLLLSCRLKELEVELQHLAVKEKELQLANELEKKN